MHPAAVAMAVPECHTGYAPWNFVAAGIAAGPGIAAGLAIAPDIAPAAVAAETLRSARQPAAAAANR
jgi:hypothetical protein